MEIKEIVSQLKDKFGDKIDVTKIVASLNKSDHSKMAFTDIVAKLRREGLVGDLDGDGKQESVFEELKGKAGQVFGNVFHHHKA